MELRNATHLTAPVGILIVTHAKDLPWLEYCLRCAGKYLHGFHEIVVAHPSQERNAFKPIESQFGARLHPYMEATGKGMLHHMIKMAYADQIVGTPFVMHLDADCMFHTHTTPEDYFFNDKPQYLFRTWESLSSDNPHDPTKKIVSDCVQWREPTNRQLGFPSTVYTMTRHPTLFPNDFYERYRAHVSSATGRDFSSFMLSGRNSFPQDRMDFTAMGAFAWEKMQNQFHWINCGAESYPKDRQRCYWSHGGVTPEIRAEIESFIN